MADGCMNCRRWEEDLYWSRFQTLQFCQILSGSFDRQRVIPEKFHNNVIAREKLAATVALKGPSGLEWNVGLTKVGDTFVLKKGWKAFIADHFFKENDILVSKYYGNSRFDVSMFDGDSFCEKEASYFVRKCTHTETDSDCKRKRNTIEITEDTNESNDFSEDDVEHCSVKKSRTDAAKTPISSGLGPRANSKPGRGRTIRLFGNGNAKTPTSSRLASQANAKSGRGNKRGRRGSSRITGRYASQLTSHRRSVTEEEKRSALEKAKADATTLDNCFIVIMRPTHVYRGFYMSIPAEWLRLHLPRKSQDLVLRLKEKKWQVRYHERGFGGGLIGGWKSFVFDNSLEEFDICLFHRASVTINSCIVLDVSIFSVIEDVTPPSRVQASNSRLEWVSDEDPEEHSE